MAVISTTGFFEFFVAGAVIVVVIALVDMPGWIIDMMRLSRNPSLFWNKKLGPIPRRVSPSWPWQVRRVLGWTVGMLVIGAFLLWVTSIGSPEGSDPFSSWSFLLGSVVCGLIVIGMLKRVRVEENVFQSLLERGHLLEGVIIEVPYWSQEGVELTASNLVVSVQISGGTRLFCSVPPISRLHKKGDRVMILCEHVGEEVVRARILTLKGIAPFTLESPSKLEEAAVCADSASQL